ncbi:hypothetical protein ACZ90_20165 [Streptomyces albus subsp. albus]|nr:hypothetical protein ACZ90_20165 [Streptomyces albus subsp. albus]
MLGGHAPAAEGAVYLSPRYLAASSPGDHHAHLVAFATESNWPTRTEIPTSFTTTSLCGRITMRHTTAGYGPHLVITARTAEDSTERWRADIAGNVPVEFVAALTHTIAAGLETDPDHAIYGIGTEHSAALPAAGAAFSLAVLLLARPGRNRARSGRRRRVGPARSAGS